MKQPKREMQLIVWNDAHFDREGAAMGPARTYSLGYRLKDAKGCMRLAQSWSALGGYNEVLTIPYEMVAFAQPLGELEPEDPGEPAF
jgi:hypothetical protein